MRSLDCDNQRGRASYRLCASPFGSPRRAFSLAELTMILIIMSLMAGVALPRYGRSMARYRVYVAARRVAADLTLARERARITSASQQVVFDSTLNRYQLPGVADTRLSTDTYTVRLADNPYHAKLSSPVFGSDAIVVFDGYGRPDSGGSVVVLVGSESKTITLAAESGEVAIQ